MIYQRIVGLPHFSEFSNPELRALASVWKEKKSELSQTPVYKDFIRRLQREWAIETGIIERLYSWDRGVTEVLIEQGIESTIISHYGRMSQDDAQHVSELISDQFGIVNGLFEFVKGEAPLTEVFIRGLQEQFTRRQDTIDAVTPSGDRIRVELLKGRYKKHPNNPRRSDGSVHEYCPPEFVQDEMLNLIEWYRDSVKSHSSEVRAAWLHHRFTQIHPFQDGNGRVARALASLVFLQDGLFPLVIRDSDRGIYITALEEADNGDLRPLVDLFSRRQKDAVLNALSLEREAQRVKISSQIIDLVVEGLRAKLNKERGQASSVYSHADRLFAFTDKKLIDIKDAIDGKLQELNSGASPQRYHARQNSAQFKDNDRNHYFKKQIIEAAQKLNYFANLDHYRSWLRVTISTEQSFDYVVSLHGLGSGETGVLVVSAFTYVKAEREDGGTEPVDLRLATEELFQFNYKEDYSSIERRYSIWLEESISIAMAEWKKSLQL